MVSRTRSIRKERRVRAAPRSESPTRAVRSDSDPGDVRRTLRRPHRRRWGWCSGSRCYSGPLPISTALRSRPQRTEPRSARGHRRRLDHHRPVQLTPGGDGRMSTERARTPIRSSRPAIAWFSARERRLVNRRRSVLPSPAKMAACRKSMLDCGRVWVATDSTVSDAREWTHRPAFSTGVRTTPWACG